MISKLENDLDFLMARLSCCVDDKSVSKHACMHMYNVSVYQPHFSRSMISLNIFTDAACVV